MPSPETCHSVNLGIRLARNYVAEYQSSMHSHHTQMESRYMMVNFLVGTENLSDVRGRGCPCLPSEERLPCAGGK